MKKKENFWPFNTFKKKLLFFKKKKKKKKHKFFIEGAEGSKVFLIFHLFLLHEGVKKKS